MKTLPETAPLVYEEMLNGALTAKATNQPFNQVSLDLRLEQSLNKSAKGSIVGITLIKAARERWFLTAHIQAEICEAVDVMCGFDSNKILANAKELGEIRMEQEKHDVGKMFDIFNTKLVNPFEEHGKDFLHIGTRHKDPEVVVKSMYATAEIGLKQVDVFVEERLQTNALVQVLESNEEISQRWHFYENINKWRYNNRGSLVVRVKSRKSISLIL